MAGSRRGPSASPERYGSRMHLHSTVISRDRMLIAWVLLVIASVSEVQCFERDRGQLAILQHGYRFISGGCLG